MKKILILLLLILSSCASKKLMERKANIRVETPKIVPTADTTLAYPFLHINGFKDYEIMQSNMLKTRDSIYAHELRFNATYSSFYTKQLMYEFYGMWDEEFRLENEDHPALIWRNVKLFPSSDYLFTVLASGFENPDGPGCISTSNSFSKQIKGSNEGIYANLIILDEAGYDSLNTSNSELKESVIDHFSYCIENLSNSDAFYRKYWPIVRKYQRRK